MLLSAAEAVLVAVEPITKFLATYAPPSVLIEPTAPVVAAVVSLKCATPVTSNKPPNVVVPVPTVNV